MTLRKKTKYKKTKYKKSKYRKSKYRKTRKFRTRKFRGRRMRGGAAIYIGNPNVEYTDPLSAELSAPATKAALSAAQDEYVGRLTPEAQIAYQALYYITYAQNDKRYEDWYREEAKIKEISHKLTWGSIRNIIISAMRNKIMDLTLFADIPHALPSNFLSGQQISQIAHYITAVQSGQISDGHDSEDDGTEDEWLKNL